MSKLYDIFVIGGGINGCGIARDAAGRGASVYLAEQGDFASATSSASTKLIHGGLRYLEYYEFRLVREALIEREVLLNAAPHIAWPLRFVLPHHKDLRPAWLIRLGLFLYDHLGGRKLLPGTRSVRLDTGALKQGLRPLFKKGFEYSDCWVDDARLVVLNARDAAARGANLQRNCRVIDASRSHGEWLVTVQHVDSDVEEKVRARAIVNAAGPWAASLMQKGLGSASAGDVRLVKGSHIIVPSLFDHDRCFIFQNADGRIVFAIPYEGQFTLIGTTDVDYKGDPGAVKISESEIEYLCRAVSQYFETEVRPEDVVHTYSGVRPLYDDGASDAKAATRDYVLELDTGSGQAPLLNIFGGKITTYRRLAESALEKLKDVLPAGQRPWTAATSLPGGRFSPCAVASETEKLRSQYGFLTEEFAVRLMRSYGLDSYEILGAARSVSDLGVEFGKTLYEKEVEWLIENEWVRCADDLLWRRSKLGLHLSAEAQQQLKAYLDERFGVSNPSTFCVRD
ncbi:glycerol-3-phosphate dehydrogenase [Polycladidibacter hongkongensis]|uniref:glycerol-3-phosphate dehydrogenase n=1 Tax=Polycladidibacter hongkongensis TaxID=1647556 RepID=UPI00082F8DF5|nr:glycerol-3-phosphate dehydrogenase [Pseudovibrio hongkongensis]